MNYIVYNPNRTKINSFIGDNTPLGMYFTDTRNGVPYNVDLVVSSLQYDGILATEVTFREGNYFMNNDLVLYDGIRMRYTKCPKHSVICLGGVILDPLLSYDLFSVEMYIDRLYYINKYVSTVFSETFIYEENHLVNGTLRDLLRYGTLYDIEDTR